MSLSEVSVEFYELVCSLMGKTVDVKYEVDGWIKELSTYETKDLAEMLSSMLTDANLMEQLIKSETEKRWYKEIKLYIREIYSSANNVYTQDHESEVHAELQTLKMLIKNQDVLEKLIDAVDHMLRGESEKGCKNEYEGANLDKFVSK